MYGSFLGGGPRGEVDKKLKEGKRGEAGQYMERVVFGALVTVLEDPDGKENRVFSPLPALVKNSA